MIIEVYRSAAVRTYGGNLVQILAKLYRSELEAEQKTEQFLPSKWFLYKNGKVVIADDVINNDDVIDKPVTNPTKRSWKKNILIVTRCDTLRFD